MPALRQEPELLQSSDVQRCRMWVRANPRLAGWAKRALGPALRVMAGWASGALPRRHHEIVTPRDHSIGASARSTCIDPEAMAANANLVDQLREVRGRLERTDNGETAKTASASDETIH